MKKYKWLYAIPAVVGVYLIYLQLRKKSVPKLSEVVVPPTIPPVGSPSTYPLKTGVYNSSAVELLQGVLNRALPSGKKLVVDGDFGPKTEEALYSITMKRVINNSSEFQSVIDDVNEIISQEEEVENGQFDPTGIFK
jgi:hypothetical protein